MLGVISDGVFNVPGVNSNSDSLDCIAESWSSSQLQGDQARIDGEKVNLES